MERKAQRIYEFGPFVLDTVQHLLVRQQEPVALTPKTYDTLLVLVENRGRMLSKDELIKALWPESFVEESNLAVQISMLRKVLGNEHRYIVTVPGRGYRFDAAVKERQQGRAETHIAELADASRKGWPTTGSLALHAVPQTHATPARPRRIRLWLAAGGATLAAAVILIVSRGPMPPPRVLRYTQITSSGRVDTVSKIVTDGTRVYFAAHPIGRRTLSLNQASVDGRETAEIPIPFEGFFLCSISPDHSELLMGSSPETPVNHPLWGGVGVGRLTPPAG
jgi:DNA-binding winged helix-turn-helix (wHTH) protein